jgi:hypothetical protein
MRNREIASLPLIRQQQDPVGWLAEHLEVGFFPGSELMYVRLSGTRDQVEQLTKLVDAVAKAYEQEVIYAEVQTRLSTRDLLAESVRKLNNELKDKMEMYHELAREQGMIDSGPGHVAQELDLKRLDRIETELMRLENARLELETSGQPGRNMKFYETRISQLSKRQEELEKKVLERSDTSVDLVRRFREVEQLQKLVNEMSVKLEMLDIEANAPRRIKQVQPAVPTGVGNPAEAKPAK